MTITGIDADAERVDGREKVMGQPIFGADRLLPGMAHAVPVSAAVGRGRILRVDTSAAEATAGVVLVLTHLNMDRLKPVGFGFAGGQAQQSFQPLQSDIVAYRGQPVALVVAESLETAMEAAALVKVEYEAAPFAVELNRPDAETVLQEMVTPWFKNFICGDADQALKGAAIVVDETYTTPAQHQNPIELLATVATWEGDRLTVHEGTQASQPICQGLAIALGIDVAKVRVTSPYAGGGFGQKNTLLFHTVIAAVAARRVGRPVKLVLPRAQVFHGSSFRAATRHRIRLGAEKNGCLLAGIHEISAQTSRFDIMPFTGAESTSRMYGIPNFRGVATLVRLDTQTPGFMRAPFEMSSFFAMEGAIDELAYRLGMDPVELRILNDTNVDPISGKPFTVRRLTECLQRGAERFGWARRKPEPAATREPDGTLVGFGVAAGAYPGLTAVAIATVRLRADAVVEVSVGGHEMGQGLRTAIALVTADELGVEPQGVRITIGDTIAPPQHTTAGSWGATTALPAVQDAARDVRAQLIALVTSRTNLALQGADPARLVIRDGRIEGPNGSNVGLTDLLANAKLSHIEGRSERLAPGQTSKAMDDASAGKVAIAGPEYPDFVSFSYVAHFAEVRVHPRLRRVKVSRMVSVVDCGKVISRRTAHSQVYGGLVWGVGAALSEESEVDPRFGGFLNNNIAEYQVPVNADIPPCEIEFIDEADYRLNSTGVKGVGEVATVGVAGAIANAVFHATGKRIRNLPIRIEKLLE
jgi:xanthine dehydrogenase YagR molybdenum-binding subunit